ncbi:hypothetical protein ACFQY5_34910 [Paeniroseomonas aquatica]|uniref:hypothetical protein n=1 Tax=Paeniroseomonas aquatica TaxID=373043 RepID=UPI003610180D
MSRSPWRIELARVVLRQAELGDRFFDHSNAAPSLLHQVDDSQTDLAGAWRTVSAELTGMVTGWTRSRCLRP